MHMLPHHKELTDGVGKCSVPAWHTGVPAGFCDEIAYGNQTREGRIKYDSYVPSLACFTHGGPSCRQTPAGPRRLPTSHEFHPIFCNWTLIGVNRSSAKVFATFTPRSRLALAVYGGPRDSNYFSREEFPEDWIRLFWEGETCDISINDEMLTYQNYSWQESILMAAAKFFITLEPRSQSNERS